MDSQCDVCAKLFPSKHMLQKHKLYHVEEEVACPQCYKKLKNQQYLVKLEELLPEDLHCFVEAYRMLRDMQAAK